MTLIKNFQQLFNSADSPLKGFGGGGGIKVPPIQSDYVIAIMPEYMENTNVSDYEGVLVTSLGMEMLNNGFSMNKSPLGLTTADVKFSNNFTFSFIGLPYIHKSENRTSTRVTSDEDNNLTVRKTEWKDVSSTYPSLVHYYYQQQLTKQGTLRIKTADWHLPAVYIINMRTEQPIYVLMNCLFSLPTFTVNPSSNDFIQYRTTVYYNTHKDLQYTAETFRVETNTEKFGVISDDADYEEYLKNVSGTEDFRWTEMLRERQF